MLILSRKVGERILLGDDIIVTLVRIGPNAVRLGITAPKDMSIVRDELGTIKKLQASESDIEDLGRRPINDPLGVADVYAENELIDHG